MSTPGPRNLGDPLDFDDRGRLNQSLGVLLCVVPWCRRILAALLLLTGTGSGVNAAPPTTELSAPDTLPEARAVPELVESQRRPRAVARQRRSKR